MSKRPAIALVVMLIAASHGSADWPQFLGPDRNGVYRGTPIVTTFPASGPKVVWSKKVGQGLAGPVVVGSRLILFHRVGDREVVESLDTANGTTQWQYGYSTADRDDFGFDEGPRAVPVVADGIVYTFGAQGQLHAISLDRGQRLWSESTVQKFGVPKGFFGAAGSPLVENGQVMANIGGTKAGIIAFSARKGAVESACCPRRCVPIRPSVRASFT
jgi:outer membrane protein assembly factor BamB